MLSRRLAASPEEAAAGQADKGHHHHRDAVTVDGAQVGGLQSLVDDAGGDKGQQDLHDHFQAGEPDALPGIFFVLFELSQYGFHLVSLLFSGREIVFTVKDYTMFPDD